MQRTLTTNGFRIALAAIGVMFLMLPELVWAADSLPWEGPLETLKNSLTGPVAKSIGVIALAAAGGMLAFGGELSDFTKRILMLVLALSVMLLANSFIGFIGG